MSDDVRCRENKHATATITVFTSNSLDSYFKVDTDLPTITSALYALATIMPKVASQLSNHLSTICGIYVRLVSWHSIKPGVFCIDIHCFVLMINWH